jgi:hypothetical protein
MKLFFLSLLVIGLSAPATSIAQWWNPFGPKTVEACIAEGGKSVQTEIAMKFVIQDCVSRFSKEGTAVTKSVRRQACLLTFDESRRKFVKIGDSTKKLPNVKSTYIPFSDRQFYHEQLARQLMEAEKAGNRDLVRTIAKEYRDNSIQIIHGTHLTRDFIVLLAQEQDVESMCR